MSIAIPLGTLACISRRLVPPEEYHSRVDGHWTLQRECIQNVSQNIIKALRHTISADTTAHHVINTVKLQRNSKQSAAGWADDTGAAVIAAGGAMQTQYEGLWIFTSSRRSMPCFMTYRNLKMNGGMHNITQKSVLMLASISGHAEEWVYIASIK